MEWLVSKVMVIEVSKRANANKKAGKWIEIKFISSCFGNMIDFVLDELNEIGWLIGIRYRW